MKVNQPICVLMLNCIVWNRTISLKIDLALNNLQRLICHKTQSINNQPAEELGEIEISVRIGAIQTTALTTDKCLGDMRRVAVI